MYPMTGNIYLADLPHIKNIQSGKRPVIVIQNNAGNKHADFVHVVPLSTRVDKAAHIPTHVNLEPNEINGLDRASVALVENIRPAPKDCIGKHIGHLSDDEKNRIGDAIRIQFPFK